MDQKRKDYLRRLVDSVKKTIAEEPENIEAEKIAGEGATTAKWMDIALLCYVIEKDILQ